MRLGSASLTTPKRKPGNPNFVKGHKGGPGRPKGMRVLVKVQRCADFMEAKGWKELESLALSRMYPKVQVLALQLLAAYGYGKPSETVDISSGGQTLTEFLTQQPSGAIGGNA